MAFGFLRLQDSRASSEPGFRASGLHGFRDSNASGSCGIRAPDRHGMIAFLLVFPVSKAKASLLPCFLPPYENPFKISFTGALYLLC